MTSPLSPFTPARAAPPERPDLCQGTRRFALGGLLATALAAVGGLSGCASLYNVAADVSSYGQWPPERTAPRYVFERLPSQQLMAEAHARVEAAAAPVLAAKGFVPVASADLADVLVQVAVRTTIVQDDPFHSPYDGRFFGGRFGLGGGLWGGRGGVGIGINLEPAQTQMQADVLIRDRRSSQTLYETHAVHQRYGSVVESLMPALFQAAMMDFPAQGISPRRVVINAQSAASASSASPAAVAASEP